MESPTFKRWRAAESAAQGVDAAIHALLMRELGDPLAADLRDEMQFARMLRAEARDRLAAVFLEMEDAVQAHRERLAVLRKEKF